MDFNVDQFLDKITAFIKSEVKTESVIGEAFTLGEYTCVPVIKTGFGLGSGGGNGMDERHGKGSGAGGGAGMGIAPVGFLVTRGSEISFISAEKTGGFGKALEKVPDLISKMMEKKEERGNGLGE